MGIAIKGTATTDVRTFVHWPGLKLCLLPTHCQLRTLTCLCIFSSILKSQPKLILHYIPRVPSSLERSAPSLCSTPSRTVKGVPHPKCLKPKHPISAPNSSTLLFPLTANYAVTVSENSALSPLAPFSSSPKYTQLEMDEYFETSKII